MRPLVSAPRGRLEEVYLGFQKGAEIIGSYIDISNKVDSWFERMPPAKVITLQFRTGWFD